MSQPTVAAYFNTRKRPAAVGSDAGVAAAIRSKVLVLEQDGGRVEEAGTGRVVFANYQNFLSKNAIADAGTTTTEKMAATPETRRVTRATRSIKRIGAVTVDEKTREMLEQPKLVKFLKMGMLSPKKRLQASPAKAKSATPTKAASQPVASAKVEFGAANSAGNVDRGMKTPTKVAPVPVAGPSVSEMSMDQIKAKLSRSARLAELKTSLNKLQSGFDKLDRMEKVRLEETRKKPVPPSPGTAARNLKEFQTLEVEVPVSPQKPFASPTKMLHRTPTKANHSSLMSPQKSAVTPKRLAALMSPIKSPSKATPVTASPTKVPAYQRFQTLADSGRPALQLPYKYRCLGELFKCIDTVCAMFHNRKEQITFRKLKPAVQRMARKNFYESHLAQINTLFPDAFLLSQEMTKNYGSATKHETYQLVIKPNVEEKAAKPVDDDSNVIRNAQNTSMNPQILIERCQKFNRLLLAKAKDAHEKFLLALDPPMRIAKEKLTRWHPEFDLESCPDIAQTPLPLPPNVERFSSAKDVLSTARNLFNCGTAMERALDRLEEKKRQESTVTSDATPTPTEPPTKTDDPVQSALKNVPKSLLEKIRAKQAAKALDQMTRRPSQEKEAITYGRLPEIARHLRNVFVTERKSVLPLESALVKIENSYRGKLTLRDLEEHLKIMAQLVPFWLTLTEVRKTMYAKISKDCDLGKVVTLLEKKANETLRC
ncbi:DNA replication factor Cdt1 [Culex quinquefasciatus]|uniref:DNA replication factor Cdt1 n=1 Tax=Culex quinquefasciatus TaxID=7176 RepID=B0WRV5_CULQU|nr:DNA replication factor Cdt1 [Culex quinquefasciatus]|eukprot:XP_001851439.1 DNA replication factor Cdt1 [Culex quinquefasciatus]